MAKKFFYNKVPNTKRTITNIVIIGVCIIGVIVCFIITSSFEGENKNPTTGSLSINKEVMVEVNEDFTNEIFFSQIANADLNAIKVTYPDNYNISKVGSYKIGLEINEKKYNTTLNVVDTVKPELKVKEITIKENETYSAKKFVENCADNSTQECLISFAEAVDQEGQKVDYSNYTTAGTYPIKISAKDESGNQTVQETKLIITKTSSGSDTPKPPQIATCKYGDNQYNVDDYTVAIDITTNKCAVSLDLYKDASMTKEINKIMDNETIKIKKEVNALKLTGTLALNRKVTAVVNNSGNGIVGYELRMTVTITNDNETNTVADYKVDKNGKRVFMQNPYNLAK